MADFVQVDDSRALVALGKFRLSLEQKGELMQELGVSQLLSVRRTFREQGSPADSWTPLAASTIKRNPKIYGAGHKLLILSGRLLNSIGVAQDGPDTVMLRTNVPYAAAQQFGSRDRSVGIGPQTEAESKATVNVDASSYYRRSAELGAVQKGKRKLLLRGPRNAKLVTRRSHTRHQNIPPRPYLVFRPEDPARLAGIVGRYVKKAADQAGLGGGQ